MSELIIRRSSEIKGNDYIYNEWNLGMLVLNDSIFSKQEHLKYDVYNDRVCIKYSDNLDEIIEITDRSLTGFSILEGDSRLKHDFVKLNSSNFTGEANTGFYEIVFNIQNTNYFIKKNAKIVFDPNRSKGSQTENNFPLEYQDKTTYYLKNDKGLYKEVRLKEKDIMPILKHNTKALSSYIEAYDIRFNKEEDVMKLVNYYYSL